MSHFVFILGGIKSGKSDYAEQLARDQQESQGKRVVYLATATVQDDETNERVRRHQARRPHEWLTEESPLEPQEVIARFDGQNAVIILDCLNFYLTNLLIEADADRDDADRERIIKGILRRVEDLVAAVKGSDAHVIAVSNEVGQCLVALNRLGRIFQDIMGMAHQTVARAADEVYVVTAGIPQRIK